MKTEEYLIKLCVAFVFAFVVEWAFFDNPTFYGAMCIFVGAGIFLSLSKIFGRR